MTQVAEYWKSTEVRYANFRSCRFVIQDLEKARTESVSQCAVVYVFPTIPILHLYATYWEYSIGNP